MRTMNRYRMVIGSARVLCMGIGIAALFAVIWVPGCCLPGTSEPLVANAGADQITTPGTPVTLDGSNSGGFPLLYQWWVEEAPPGGQVTYLTDTGQATIQVVCNGNGDYTFTLRVTRNAIHDWDTVRVSIGPPVADAGPDRNVISGFTATLDGSNSHSQGGGPLTYAWWVNDAPPGGQVTYLTNTNQATLQVKCVGSGQYEFTLRVTENGVHDWDSALVEVERSFIVIPTDLLAVD